MRMIYNDSETEAITAIDFNPCLTNEQKACRRYEYRHKKERRESHKCLVAKLPIAEYNEIQDFLKSHHLTIVELARAGYQALVEKYQ